MVKLTDKQKEFIVANLPNGQKLIKSENVREILLPLDAFISDQGMNDDYSLNDLGVIAQNIYDEIYFTNT
jgi:hypothetical protein